MQNPKNDEIFFSKFGSLTNDERALVHLTAFAVQRGMHEVQADLANVVRIPKPVTIQDMPAQPDWPTLTRFYVAFEGEEAELWTRAVKEAYRARHVPRAEALQSLMAARLASSKGQVAA